MKKILIYRYNNICEPDVIDCFKQAGLTVVEERTQMTRKDTTAAQTAEAVSALLKEKDYLFVFSINFFPAVSEVCEIFHIPYVSWTVDCPVMELFSPSLSNDCNRVFFFDRAQYDYFAPRVKPGHAFRLPLASNVTRWDAVIDAAARDGENMRFGTEISFVGSLYQERNRYLALEPLLEEGARESLRSSMEKEACIRRGITGTVEKMLIPEILEEIREKEPAMREGYAAQAAEAGRFYAAHMLLDWEITRMERCRLLDVLGERFPVTVYTHSDISMLKHIRALPGVDTLTQMPLVFRYSKINLNITMRAIETGLPLRVFDICGAGGFCLTDARAELSEFFITGREVESFSSEEELIDKAAYYLSHDSEREKIAQCGCKRVRSEHTYYHRINRLIKELLGTM